MVSRRNPATPYASDPSLDEGTKLFLDVLRTFSDSQIKDLAAWLVSAKTAMGEPAKYQEATLRFTEEIREAFNRCQPNGAKSAGLAIYAMHQGRSLRDEIDKGVG